jgi:hypothetical protein
VTISRQDVYELSRGPGPGGTPLSVAEADRVAAVLNQHGTHRPTVQPAAETPAATSSRGTGEPTPEPEQAAGVQVPRDRVLAVMTRVGFQRDEIEQAAAVLPEQVDQGADHVVLARLSLTQGELMQRLGSSP